MINTNSTSSAPDTHLLGTDSGVETKSRLQPLRSIDRFTFFSAATYICLGISCAQFGIVGQPVRFYMMKTLNMSAAEVSSALAILMLPWIVKPLYGMISDLFPLFGYRRKSYLINATIFGALGFAGMCTTDSLNRLLLFLGVTAISTAIVTALMVALAVEMGRKTEKARHYFSVQEVAFYATSMLVATASGFLCHELGPEIALKTCACLSVFPLLAISLLTFRFLDEKKMSRDCPVVMANVLQEIKAVSSKSFCLLAVLTACWTFAPAVGIPLYFFESNALGYSQAFIGQLSSWNALGMLAGGALSTVLLAKLDRTGQIVLAVSLLSISALSYLALSSPESAIVVEVFRGMASLFSIVCIYGLAADICPKGTEATLMSLMVAILNLTTNASNYIGGYLFTHVFDNSFYPLVIISAVVPVFSLVITRVAKER